MKYLIIIFNWSFFDFLMNLDAATQKLTYILNNKAFKN